MRPNDILKILEQEFHSTQHNQHTPVMIWGAPGVGKSQLVAQIADKNKVPVIDIRLSQIEPSDLRGIPFRDQDTVTWAIPDILPNEKRHGETGILFLDEINAAAPSISAAAYQLILDRKLGNYTLPHGWAIFAAGNRQGDKGVTYNMPTPLANRFSHFELETHLDDWVEWAYANHIDERIIAFLRFKPELLFNYDPSNSSHAFPTPRSWEFAHRALFKFEKNTMLLLGALQACVGSSAGVEAHAFVQHYKSLPNIDAIVNGTLLDVPEKIDLQYAVASALVGRAIKEKGNPNFGELLNHILNYASQFSQREMGIMLVSDLCRVIGEPVFQAEKFNDWATLIADLVLYD